MRIGLITGSGGHEWPGLERGQTAVVETEHGSVEVVRGTVAGVEVVQVSRHGSGHERLSHQVRHKANLTALLASGVDGVIAVTVCGSVDPRLDPGTVVVFDDLYFPTNRLPDGSPCTWYDVPGAPRRGHWIAGTPFSESLRRALVRAAPDDLPLRDGGCYGHVDGPRFNTRTEIAALAAVGVTAISQTAGPEVVLAGEAELPLALVGFVTDYANGVVPEPEPLEALLGRMAASAPIVSRLVQATLPTLSQATPAGTVHRFAP